MDFRHEYCHRHRLTYNHRHGFKHGLGFRLHTQDPHSGVGMPLSHNLAGRVVASLKPGSREKISSPLSESRVMTSSSIPSGREYTWRRLSSYGRISGVKTAPQKKEKKSGASSFLRAWNHHCSIPLNTGVFKARLFHSDEVANWPYDPVDHTWDTCALWRLGFY